MATARQSARAAIHRALVDATKPTTGNVSVPIGKHLEAQLCSWMTDEVLGTRPSSARHALAIQRTRVVEERIDANLANPMTAGRLSVVAGVGDRRLEHVLRAHRGQTPLPFVMARRLAWVRRRLLEPGPGDSVTQLAHDARLAFSDDSRPPKWLLWRIVYGDPSSQPEPVLRLETRRAQPRL